MKSYLPCIGSKWFGIYSTLESRQDIFPASAGMVIPGHSMNNCKIHCETFLGACAKLNFATPAVSWSIRLAAMCREWY